MILTLAVLPPQSAPLGDEGRHTFCENGGTIGRASSCDWVLSHRKVSGRHATISYQDGVFYIVDEQSANGVFLNSTKSRLVPGRRYALKNREHIIIDPYEMEVSISTEGGQDARRANNLEEPGGPSQGGRYNPFEVDDPFAPSRRTPAAGGAPRSTPRPHPAGEVVPLEELDPLKLLEGQPKAPPLRHAPNARELDNASPLAGHYQPPAVLTPPPTPPAVRPSANATAIPADYDPLKDDFDEPFEIPPPPVMSRTTTSPPPAQASPPSSAHEAADPWPLVPPDADLGSAVPTPAPRHLATPTPRAGVPPRPEVVQPAGDPVRVSPSPVSADERADSGLLAVLAGAGLHQAPVTLEFARNFGQIFRVVVSGVMDVLRSRQQIKDEFRIRGTQFRPADNNPLKFSANVDDALHNLLVKRNAAYLQPVEAFEDAFDDLRDHQMAMLAGMRVAYEAMLAHFDPEALQKEFDRQLKRSALLGVTTRLRYWDLYRERQDAMAKDPEASFRRLFGEEFAKAYEEQLRRLKAERRDRAPAPRPPDA